MIKRVSSYLATKGLLIGAFFILNVLLNSRQLLVLAPVVLGYAGAWLFSLRRTLDSAFWLAMTIFVGLGTSAAALAIASDSKITMSGELALAMVLLIPALIAVASVEIYATLEGDIKSFRNKSYTRELQWKPVVESSDNKVYVRIEKGSKDKFIGSADPVEDMDGFMDLRAKAEQAAESFNALKVI